jgi:hypothetical protein
LERHLSFSLPIDFEILNALLDHEIFHTLLSGIIDWSRCSGQGTLVFCGAELVALQKTQKISAFLKIYFSDFSGISPFLGSISLPQK